MSHISFRNSKIPYYGPHACENCDVLIVKMAIQYGGNAFTNPSGPIYPNTEWHPHVCDPQLVRAKLSRLITEKVLKEFPNAQAVRIGRLGYVIVDEEVPIGVTSGIYQAISAHATFATTKDEAWQSAMERQKNGWPTWHINLADYPNRPN